MTLGELWRRLRFVLHLDRHTRDLEEEMRLHVELRAERLRESGRPADDAASTARTRFGNAGALADASRDAWGIERINGMVRELRVAGRSLRRAPSFSATVAATIAIGVGASACIFAVVNAVLLRPLPYASSNRVVLVQHALPGVKMGVVGLLTPGMYFTYASSAKSIEAIGAYQTISITVGDDRDGGIAERAQAGRMSTSMFSVLEGAPLIGRRFTDAEDTREGPAVALISERLWREKFNADAGILDRSISIDGAPRRVVGVMPKHFRFPESSTDVWLPLRGDPLSKYSGGFDYQAVARLRPGVDATTAAAELQSLIPRVSERFPLMAPGLPTAAMHAQAKPQASVRPLRDSLVGDFANVLWVVAGAAGLVLIVACANVVNLFLVRIDARHRELAVRTALGAGRLRIFGHVLAEISLLSAIGAALGIAAVAAGTRLIVRFAPPDTPRLTEIGIDVASVVFTIALSVGVAACCALIAALRHRPSDPGALLRDGGRTGTTGRSRQRLRGALVAAQVALAMLLLASAGVLTRSFERVRAVHPGFDATNVLTMWISAPVAKYRDPSAIARYVGTLIDRLSTVHGVAAAGATTMVPLDKAGFAVTPVWPETGPLAKTSAPPLSVLTSTTSGFFAALRIPLLAGRNLPNEFTPTTSPEIVINAALAKTLWGDSTGTRAIGQRLRMRPGGQAAGSLYTVVGVVGNVRDTSLLAAPLPAIYTTMQPVGGNDDSRIAPTVGIVVRTSDDPLLSAAALRDAVRVVDPSVPTFNVAPLRDVVSRSYARLSFTLFALGTGALVTLALSMIGLYGVISYVVSLRTREIGVRIALGARPGDIGGLVIRQAMLLTVGGIVVGSSLFVLLSRFLRGFVFGVAPVDPATLSATGVALVLVTILASWLPAQRARSVDPIEALRDG